MKSILTKSQFNKKRVIVKNSKLYPEYNGMTLTVNIRYDDECGNGHNSFAITGSCGGRNGIGGCIHDFIIEQVPSLEKYIKWHLTSSDGPMHYVANSMYHASNKDCWGKTKGEPYNYVKSLSFTGYPFTIKLESKFIEWLEQTKPKTLTIIELVHSKDPDTYSPNYTFKEYIEGTGLENSWYKNLFSSLQEAEEMQKGLMELEYSFTSVSTSIGKGKTPDLKAARSCAIWPAAKLSDFTEDKLNSRLKGLLSDFKIDIESLNFTY